MEGNLVSIIGAVGAMTAGGFAFLRYIVKENREAQKEFLGHLELKNGHMERMALTFGEKADKMSDTLADVSEKIGKTESVLPYSQTALESSTRSTAKIMEITERLSKELDRHSETYHDPQK